MKFNIDDYTGMVVMHCKTRECAKEFCEYLSSIGKTWRGGTSYNVRTNFDMYEARTCYNFQSGQYGSIEYFTENNYTILEVEYFFFYDFDVYIHFSFDEMFGGADE